MERNRWNNGRLDSVLNVLLIVLALGVLAVSEVEITIAPTQASVATQWRA